VAGHADAPRWLRPAVQRWPLLTRRRAGRRLIPITPRLSAARLDARHPFLLNTGRIRDQWHTMTRSGRSVRLLSHIAEPFVEIHPERCQGRLGVEDGRCSRFTIITAA
jgi:anaerobic selenocysteine-containing dehydrogenase